MLTLEQYGIKLIRVQKSDIELIRSWRNQANVANFMEYKKHITRWQQNRWFKQINNKNNYYFIIEFEGKKAGVINAKDVNEKERFSEGGIFIGDPGYIDSFISVYSTLCLLNFTFVILKYKRSIIKVLRSNEKAVHYNKIIGYKLLPDQQDQQFQRYELICEDYLKNCRKLNEAAAKLNPHTATLKINGVPSELNTDEINELLINQMKG